MKKVILAATLMVASSFTVQAEASSAFDGEKLDTVLAAQSDRNKARYQYRHPRETLEFIGVEPGMTVADTTSGSYYAPILLQYLGDEGALYGVNYSVERVAAALEGRDDAAERLANHKAWAKRFVERSDEWKGNSKAKAGAFYFEDMPKDVAGTVDAFLMFRAFHGMYGDVDERTAALKDAYTALKPGGVLAIVQHRAPESSTDEWANGSAGYLKQSSIIEIVKAAGFELEASSEINANPNDKPTAEDIVWRLPPVFYQVEEGEQKAAMQAIGESDRMTLKFRKP